MLTVSPGHGTKIARDVNLSPYDGVIAAGGDGTMFEVLNGYCARRQKSEVPLGILPVGTGNAVARELDLRHGDYESALEIIRRGHTRRVDVGHYRTDRDEGHFLNILGFGFVVDANRSARRMKVLGNAAYTLGVLHRLVSMKCRGVSIEMDGKRIERENLFIEVSNTRYTGTSFLMAPAARIDDGLLDVTIVGKMSRGRLLRLFPTVYSGAHIHLPEVETRQARQIRIEAVGLLSPDGEMRGSAPVDIECRPGAVRLFWRA